MLLQDSAVTQFLTLLQATSYEQWVRLSLAKYRGSQPQLERILMKPARIKSTPCLSLTYRYANHDICKNIDWREGGASIAAALQDGFKSAHLTLTDKEVILTLNKKNKGVLRVVTLAEGELATSVVAESHGHDREKNYLVRPTQPFWRELGVTNHAGELIPAMSRKWKQVNKFIEVIASAMTSVGYGADAALKVVDFGSGKGYLTFALYDYLKQTQTHAAEVTGVELRGPLVSLCQHAADVHGLRGLSFYEGDVKSYVPEHVDIMIALHACDVATDYALFTGIRLGASVIVCAPCCHKELRPQMTSPNVLKPLLMHGVHKGQTAEMLTDSLRAMLLEACGYETKVFEFVALEHTSKNKMILATRRKTTKPQADILQAIAALKSFYSIEQQTLEQLLYSAQLINLPC